MCKPFCVQADEEGGQSLVAIHPEKLSRFLCQLQAIQAKVTTLQVERQAACEKAKAVEVRSPSSARKPQIATFFISCGVTAKMREK